MKSVNQKLLQYAEYKGISQRKFTQSLGLSEGVLRKGKNLGSGYLKNIKEKYHDLNMNWLLYDEGEMILKFRNMAAEGGSEYGKDCSKCEKLEKELESTRKLLDSKNETITILKHQLGIKD